MERLIAWATEHELLMITDAGETVHAPFALEPTKFPRRLYEEAVAVQPLFSKLVYTIVRERRFLEEISRNLSAHDDFIGGLLRIFQAVGPVSKYFAVNRSDYMVHEGRQLLQIEMNTISVSFPALASRVAQMHRELVAPSVVPNDSLRLVVDGFRAALEVYGRGCTRVLMVVRPQEVNVVDQDGLIKALNAAHGITAVRRTLLEIGGGAALGPEGELLVDGCEVGVVYYRTAYTATDYPTDREWAARHLLESSSALKCPDVGSQLAGSKKIQQELCVPDVLERFLPPEEASGVRKYFTGLYALDDPATVDATVEMALRHPERYVLKPQREGGGNNHYGREMADILRSRRNLGAYILMDLIVPYPAASTLVRNSRPTACQTVCELGIYGVCVRDGDTDVMNVPAGYLLRTKASDVLEGGVSTGFSVLDSIDPI